ncbi:MAG: DUF4194 domain-containing protein [Candidatus Paceibacterota bacterium]|jgi:hypothetical protein
MNPALPNPESSAEPALSGIVIPLLKGVVYQESDSALWGQLLGLEARVRDYVGVLNLELVLDEAEGYAFLRSRAADPESESASLTDTSAPRLYPRRPLSFPVSLLLVLLRKKLAEFDTSGGDARLVLTREEITEMLRLFLPAQANEVRLTDQIETHLNKIAELGFVRKLKSQAVALQPAAYEVRRILKAFVDAQWLADFDARLDSYRRQFEIPIEEPNDD